MFWIETSVSALDFLDGPFDEFVAVSFVQVAVVADHMSDLNISVFHRHPRLISFITRAYLFGDKRSAALVPSIIF